MVRIMIVDDEEGLRTVVRAILEKAGHEVLEAESGKNCIDLLEKGPRPDYILLDIMMPLMDGWTTCAEIKKNPDTQDIPVVMLTVKSKEEDKIKAFEECKAEWYITKPIEKDKFLTTLKWLINKKKP